MGFNGEAVPVTQPFSNGNLQPEAHPNCRCTAEFESDEEYSARTGMPLGETPTFANMPMATSRRRTAQPRTPKPKIPAIPKSPETVATATQRQYVAQQFIEVAPEEKMAVSMKLADRAFQKLDAPIQAQLKNTNQMFGFQAQYVNALDDGIVYINGPVTIIVSKQASLSPAAFTNLTETVDNFMSKNTKPVNIYVIDKLQDQEANVGGIAQRGGYDIKITQDTLENLKIGFDESASLSDQNWNMPVRKTTSEATYVLTHEYGHITDELDDKTRNDLFIEKVRMGSFKEGAGVYSGLNQYEAIAEAFTEWTLSDGKTTSRFTQLVASRLGWK